MRFLTPTDNHRLNEMVGLLSVTLAVLIALSLISYSPRDASLNVSAPPLEVRAARNWIGPVGAHGADLLFQGFGYAAFLLPVGIFLLGVRWFRSRPVPTPVAKIMGFVLWMLSLPSLFALWHLPEVRGAVPAGGLLGSLLSSGVLTALNPVGAHLVTVATFLAALFLTTRFSLLATQKWLGGPLKTIGSSGLLGRLRARWLAWHEAREQERMRKRLEQIKRVGRPPVPTQTSPVIAGRDLPAQAGEEEEESSKDVPKRGPVLVPMKEATAAPVSTKTAVEPKIARGVTSYRLPSPGLLRMAERGEKLLEEDLKECARAIEQKCEEFDVKGHVTQINPGPVVTTFEFKPEAGIKYSRITSLAEDLCLALRAESILIERIPGKSTVGIEVPNQHRQTIALREAIESPEFANSSSKLTLAMGKDLVGRIRVTDLAQMPHLLIAGATGTGKSVFINSMVVSMLFKATPDELKLVMVDPKRLELGLYEDIPHLLAPVVTDPKVASNVLRNATREMEQRLKLLAHRGVRNIDQYNQTFRKGQSLSLFDDVEQTEHRPLPYIVIVIDELADLMMVDTNNVEESVTRLAQMARAVGIHLLLATQRPSVDVITGLIKANFPARISFRVASKVDSRTILDANGAESLLGRGDMLYLPAGSARLHRIHGPLVTEEEIVAVCDFWRAQAKAKYNEQLLQPPKDDEAVGDAAEAQAPTEEPDDELYQEAVRVVCEMGRASTSTLQRRLRIGYGRAARLIDLMEKDGIVGPAEGTKPRELLKKKDWMREFDESLK
ncbi:MAG TPA: DNA translocase FtsK [Candidatus Acidoferrales bacterium]|nr:DNA translocase FtsK [Candidatus Acidoferrales bacterium]